MGVVMRGTRAGASARARLGSLAILVATLVVAVSVGRDLGAGGGGPIMLALAGGVLLVATPIGRRLGRRLPPGILALEVPVVLLLTSTLVFRARTIDEIGYNPLDPAAQFRVACLGTAALLAGVALVGNGRVASPRAPVLTLPLRLYCGYVAVVFLGSFLSVNVLFTLFRAAELITALAVIIGACRAIGADAERRLERVLFGWIVAIVTSIWLGALLAPERAFSQLRRDAPNKTQLGGVFPGFASNTVGVMGALLMAWSIARLVTPGMVATARARAVHAFLAAAGLTTVLFAQYRTGYIAIVLTLAVALVVRRMWRTAAVAVLALGLWLSAVPTIVTDVWEYALRGQSAQEAEGLSNRLDWWSLAIPVWEKSPILGRGLLTASRIEVLGAAGDGGTSSVHSAWVEALVGTGVVGLALLIGFTLIVAFRSAAATRRAQYVPLLVVTVIIIRSITAKSVDSLTLEAMVMLALAARPDPARRQVPTVAVARRRLARPKPRLALDPQIGCRELVPQPETFRR